MQRLQGFYVILPDFQELDFLVPNVRIAGFVAPPELFLQTGVFLSQRQ
jgi:hypothetical protein